MKFLTRNCTLPDEKLLRLGKVVTFACLARDLLVSFCFSPTAVGLARLQKNLHWQ